MFAAFLHERRRAFLLLPVCLLLAAPAFRSSGRVGYRLVRHPRSGAVLPRLTRFRDPKIQEAVNRQLDVLAASFSCDPGHAADETVEVKAKVTYAADDVLSISIRASYNCPAAYPTIDANRSVTYDLRTGALVPFAALFQDYERDGAAIVRALYPEHVARAEAFAAGGKGESESGSCDDHPELFSFENLLDNGFSYALSPRGLTVQPDFPHVDSACAEEVTVPFERVRRFAAPQGVLSRVGDLSSRPGG